MNEAVISRIVDQKLVSGISWASYEEGQWQQGVSGKRGMIPPYQEQDLNGTETYDLASLTKVIGTTTRVLQLIDQGSLRLTDQVRGYLPQLAFLDLTIEELLLHRSGLPADYPRDRPFTEAGLVAFLKECRFDQEPRMVYSDLGFILLGWIIEEVDGTDLETSFQKQIFRPLGMTHTSYFPPETAFFVPTEVTAERGLVVGTVHDEKAAAFPRPLGHAGLFADLRDLIRFVDGIRQNELFSADLFQRLLDTDLEGRTFGWERAFDGRILFHTGFTGTAIGIDVANQQGLIMLANRIHPTREDHGFLKARFEVYKEFFDGKGL